MPMCGSTGCKTATSPAPPTSSPSISCLIGRTFRFRRAPPPRQARVIQDGRALGSRENFRVNVIEAFDEPWKRALEGTVGGHWGLLDDAGRTPKFAWGQAVSNHPQWLWQASGGILFALTVFGAAFATRRDAGPAQWLAVTANAIAGGTLIG